MKTTQLRTQLYFLYFIEKNIITMQTPTDLEGNNGFYQWMALHLK